MQIDPAINKAQQIAKAFGNPGIERIPGNKEIDIGGIDRGEKFSNFIKDAINSVDDAQKTAAQSAEDVVAGRTDNIHEVMINMEKAQLSFDLMLEIRNKMIDTYQELSRIQI